MLDRLLAHMVIHKPGVSQSKLGLRFWAIAKTKTKPFT